MGDARRSPKKVAQKVAMDMLEHRSRGGKPTASTQLPEAFADVLPKTNRQCQTARLRRMASSVRSEYALDKMGPWEPLQHR